MPINRNALVRFKTIDKCLQNYYRRWTLDDLVEACSEALYEYEGITKGVSVRTIQADIQMMRSDKLGYNAPIIVIDKKYYEYEDRKYSITNIPLTGADLSKLNESVEFLKQFKGFSHFKELEGVIQKLEDHVHSKLNKQRPIIDFDRNDDVKGLEFIDFVYQAIAQKSAISIEYKSYKAREALKYGLQPLLLKEFRNRWYVIGKKPTSNEIINLALDRVVSMERSNERFDERFDFDPSEFYKDVIGVTVEPGGEPIEIRLLLNWNTAPYVITKPIHHSQKIENSSIDGIEISIKVQHNHELEKEILSHGENIKVLAPRNLKRIIAMRLSEASDLYSNEVTEKQVKIATNKIKFKSFAPILNVYTKREIHLIKYNLEKNIDKFSSARMEIAEAQRILKKGSTSLLNFNFNKLTNSLSANYVAKTFCIIEDFESISTIDAGKSSLLFCVPLNVELEIPAMLRQKEVENSAATNSVSTGNDYVFYLTHGSALICKTGLSFELINPDKRTKLKIAVVEMGVND